MRMLAGTPLPCLTGMPAAVPAAGAARPARLAHTTDS